MQEEVARTKFGKLESSQWSVVSDLADPSKLNAKSAEGLDGYKTISLRGPSTLSKWGEEMKRIGLAES